MKKQFSEPTELSMEELDLVNGGTGLEELSEPAMFEDTSGTPAAQNFSGGTHSGDPVKVLPDIGLPKKCSNPNCIKCGIVVTTINKRCTYCGSFLILSF